MLDEIGELPLPLQPKLLRVLEERVFERVGGTQPVRANVRVIATTNRDLRVEVDEGRFRADLFYRLHVMPIRLPALRERPGDVALLAGRFLAKFRREMPDSEVRELAPATLQLLEAWPWPGNVRELENLVQRLVLLDRGPVIEPEHLPPEVREGEGRARGAGVTVGATVAEVEKELILSTLRSAGNNKTRAARILGVTARTLSNKLKAYARTGAAENP
jgi:transcriptional regulator with PAS, ATPase and Fis domain